MVAACKPSLTFGAVAAQLFTNEQARVQRGEFALGSLQVLRNRLDAHILPQFAKRSINSIDYSDLLAFSQHLSSSLTTTTVSQYLVAVRKVFTHEMQTKIITAAPTAFKAVVVLMPAQTPKQRRQQSGVLQGWLEWEMIMVQGSTPVGPRHELSVHPTLCDMPLVMECRLLRSGLDLELQNGIPPNP